MGDSPETGLRRLRLSSVLGGRRPGRVEADNDRAQQIDRAVAALNEHHRPGGSAAPQLERECVKEESYSFFAEGRVSYATIASYIAQWKFI